METITQPPSGEPAQIDMNTPVDPASFGSDYSDFFTANSGIKTIGDVLARAKAAGTAPTLGLDTPLNMDVLPDDMKNILASKKIDSFGGFVDMALAAEQRVGRDTIVAPNPAERDKFWSDNAKAFGVPENADGYEFKPNLAIPDDFKIDDAYFAETRKFFRENNIPKDIGDKMMAFFGDYSIKAHNGLADLKKAESDNLREELRKDWGAETDAKIELGQAAVKQLGLENEYLGMISSEIGKPALVALFARLGEELMDPSVADPASSPVQQTAASAKAEIEKLRLDTEFQAALNNKNHPGHNDAVNKWDRIYEKAYPTG